MGEDRLLQPGELWGGVDPELVGERRSVGLERPERLGLATAAVQGEHQQRPRAFPQRVAADQELALADDLVVPVQREQRFDPRLRREEPQVLQPNRRRTSPILVSDPVVRRSAPPRQGGVEHAERLGRIASVQQLATHRALLFEPRRVELVGLEAEQVAPFSRRQPVTGGFAEQGS